MRYTKVREVDMVFIYREYRQIMRAAMRLYAERFPNRARPSRSVFSNITYFQETGCVDKNRHQRSKKATDDGNTTNILAAVA